MQEVLVSDDGVQRVYRVYDSNGVKVGVRQEFVADVVAPKPPGLWSYRKVLILWGAVGAGVVEGAARLVTWLT